MSVPLRLPTPLRRGELPDTIRHLSDGAVGAAQHLTHGLTLGATEAAHAAHQLAAGAADAVSATRQTVRPRRRRRLPRGPVLVVVLFVVAVVASRWWAGRRADLRPADVPAPAAVPAHDAVDDDAVAADAGGAMA